MSEGVEEHKILHQQILRQAMDDYVKLQHPTQRRKKYLQEAWWSAIDLFFDPAFRFQNLVNYDGDPMSLKELLQVATGRTSLDVTKLQQHLIKESQEYWGKKKVRTIDIPSDLVVEGHVYAIKYKNISSYSIDHDEKSIWLNAQASASTKEELFVLAAVETIAHHVDANIPKTERLRLAKGWFRALRMNACFNGV